MKIFFKTLLNRTIWIFVALTILRYLKIAKSKSKEYLHNPNLFTKVERFELAYKACKNAIKLFNIQIIYKGFESVPKRPVLFIGNHKSEFDPIILIKIFFENEGYPFFNFVSKIEVKKNKFAKNIAELIDTIFIDRSKPRDIITTLENIKTNLLSNSVIIFPEGKRIKEPIIGDMKSGVLEPAYQGMVPIIPFVIYGSEKCKLINEKKPNFKYKEIIVEFLPQIKPKDFLNTKREFLMEKIKNQITKKYEEINHEHNHEIKKI